MSLMLQSPCLTGGGSSSSEQQVEPASSQEERRSWIIIQQESWWRSEDEEQEHTTTRIVSNALFAVHGRFEPKWLVCTPEYRTSSLLYSKNQQHAASVASCSAEQEEEATSELLRARISGARYTICITQQAVAVTIEHETKRHLALPLFVSTV